MDTLRAKRAWCRCKIKLLDSIKGKVNKNADSGNYGFTASERKAIEELKEWVKKMPD